jgi:hypothetical protein
MILQARVQGKFISSEIIEIFHAALHALRCRITED